MAVNAERRNGDNNTVKLLLDSASTIHIATSRAGMHDMKKCNKAVESANKETTYAEEMGTRKFRACKQRSGQPPIVCMSETHLMEGFLNDIVSLPMLLKKGCTVQRCDQDIVMIALPKDKHGYPHGYMEFVRGDDDLFYMEVEPVDEIETVQDLAVVSDDDDSSKEEDDGGNGNDDDNNSNDGDEGQEDSSDGKSKKPEKVNVDRAHEITNHAGETKMRAQAKEYNWKLTGTLSACDSCAKAKATAKAVPKKPSLDEEELDPGEVLHIDSSGPYKRTRGNNRFWCSIKCKRTKRVWSLFDPHKDNFTPGIMEVVQWLKAKGFEVKVIRVDNAGEWKAHLEPECKKLGIKVEYTAPHTPQQNATVEREFPVIRNMAYACLMASGMKDNEQMLHWAHAVDDCTLARNLQPRHEWKNAYEPFGEEPPVKPEHLVPWGAKGWMTKRNKIKAKFTPKAERVTRVGYATDHASGTYIVRKHSTNKYVVSRDVKWDEPRRYRKLKLEATRKPDATAATPTESDEANRFAALISDDESSSDESVDSSDGRLNRELQRIGDHNADPQSGQRLGRTRQATRQLQQQVNNVAVFDKDPANDREAMEGPEGEHWWNGLVTEYDGFFKIGTWLIKKAKDVDLRGVKPLTTKNVYKKKLHAITKEWRYRVRNCVRGFTMIPGEHFDESFAPTPAASSVRIVLAITLFILQQLGVATEEDLKRIEEEEWVVDFMFDVVQAFLTSDLDPTKPIYTHLPPYWKQYCEVKGIPFDPTDLILLQKSQYGSVDSANLWVNKFVEILTRKGGIEMTRSKVDPCVMYKKDEQGKLCLLLVFHIDDGCVAGRPEEVKKLMEHLRAEIEILEIGRMEEHLGVHYKLARDSIGWYYECNMDKYIDKTIKAYEEATGKVLKDYPTPGAPSTILMKVEDESLIIDPTEYRKYVGRILYAVTKVLPDCANAVRDLTCHMTAPGEEQWKALEHLLGHLKFRLRHLKLRAPNELRVVSEFDGDWGTDKNDRKSISSYFTTIGGTFLTNWQSKKQQTVALSSCESETMAGTLCAQEVLFEMNLLEELVGDDLQKPSYIYGDNVASLFLAQNNAVSQRTKHIDIRYRFMNDLVQSSKAELRHVKSEDNTSDINSKNTKIETHTRLSNKVYEGMTIAELDQGGDKKEADLSSSRPSKEDVGLKSSGTSESRFRSQVKSSQAKVSQVKVLDRTALGLKSVDDLGKTAIEDAYSIDEYCMQDLESDMRE